MSRRSTAPARPARAHGGQYAARVARVRAADTPWLPLAWPPRTRPGPLSCGLSIAASPRTSQTAARPRPVPAAAGNEEETPPQARQTRKQRDITRPSPTTLSPPFASPGHMEPNEPINTKFYQLGNGGSLIFEHDLNAVSDFLGRPHPEFHGVQLDDTPGGELQWVITADLRGKMEPPTSERILFSFRESNWLDGLARGLQEALARLCGQNVVRILASRYAHLVRRDAAGVPMELQPHPELRHHAEHLDFMLYQTQRDLDATRAYANQTHAHITEQGEAIKLLNNDRKSLRQQRAKKDATIRRLRTRIASLEATVKAQEDQIRQLEDDDGGIDIQGGDAFLSDDNDFEEDENTEEEDYEFLEAGPDDYVPIDVDDEE
ncbi:hypothetical protein QYE76_006119 [Lolium multiflorum]|uniref:Uncharacterized protein n=1 Tax=Lolium multiflorum TaxID=4521 RepID=A0AAD8W2Z4_LOLMU|nr:hypothetical protein QYE76_006119 [Lolium multiflorum]